MNVTSVLTDQKEYNGFQSEVPKCVAANKGSYCEYNYRYSNKDFSFKIRCVCAPDGSVGYCPLPNHQALTRHALLEV